jgi:hypothetical protein
MTPNRGNPILQVRLTPETHDSLKEAVGDGHQGGKAGGVSLFVRRLIYRELGEPMPSQWSKDDVGAMTDLHELAALVEDEATWKDREKVQDLFASLASMARTEPDLIRRNFARQILGHLASKLDLKV